MVFFIVIVSLMLLLSRRTVSEMKFETSSKVPGKTIWILWLQGWEEAPWFVKKIKDTWVRHNPEWNVELVSEANLSEYVDIYLPPDASPAAKSDIIRLNLLCTHGGVWADATLICMIPLDEWIYDALRPEGFWMYHGGDSTRPCSWFLISMKETYIIKKWKEACDEYWRDKKEADYYFWMDGLFMDLVENDDKFKKSWNNVPYLYCEDYGQSHMLAGKCHENDTQLKMIAKNNPPYVIKGDKAGPSEGSDTNMYYAIECSLTSNGNLPLHTMKYPDISSPIKNNKVAVIADCGNEVELHDLKKICDSHDIQILVYDKCEFGKFIPNGIYARPLKNVGRETETFLNFVITYYDNLPQDIYLLPGNTEKYNRKERFLKMLKDDTYIGETSYLDDYFADFTLDVWDGKSQIPAEKRPFKNWFETYICKWDKCKHKTSAVWNGTMHTTRERVKEHELNYFVSIHSQLLHGNNLEVGHYVERSLGIIF